jgi:microcystin-dependent protein
MSDPYIGEIRMFGSNFAPSGWAFCDGQLMPIAENDALFQLIGTTYGGDGQVTFGLPDLRGRIPVHAGQGPGISQSYQLAEKAGVESVTLTAQQTPVHNHALIASSDAANTPNPQGNVLSVPITATPYYQEAPGVAMNAGAISPDGGSQPHENMMPFLVVSFIISLFGIFPTQN